MITATVNLAVQASTTAHSMMFDSGTEDARRTFTACTKDDVRENVRHQVRQAYGQAVAVVAFKTQQASRMIRNVAADGIQQVLEETTHIAHIEYNDGTSEALIVEVDMTSVANAGCAHLVHTHFNQGVIGHE